MAMEMTTPAPYGECDKCMNQDSEQYTRDQLRDPITDTDTSASQRKNADMHIDPLDLDKGEREVSPDRATSNGKEDVGLHKNDTPRNPSHRNDTRSEPGSLNRTFVRYGCVVLIVCMNCYFNAIQCGFVFDDEYAVIKNEDVQPSTPILQVFKNDFWGRRITSTYSHKSYRPLVVLTFKADVAIWGMNPAGFHLANVVLHSALCVLMMAVFRIFLSEWVTFIMVLHFAVHPVHTEAVTGVVGRADILSSLCALMAFWSYTKASGYRQHTDWRYLSSTLILIVMATLCKEHGITIVGICCVYEIMWLQKINLWGYLDRLRGSTRDHYKLSLFLRHIGYRIGVLLFASVVMIAIRVSIMGAELPKFSKSDNPTAFASWPSRPLTQLYLLPLNIWLLLCPVQLLCDHSSGVIPLVTSYEDPRNLATINFIVAMVALSIFALTGRNRLSRQVAMALAFMVIPFLPASNLFFPVGFVIAERILYTPSIGFSMLVCIGIQQILKHKRFKHITYMLLITTLVLYAARTIRRNEDWKTGRALFRSGLQVSTKNVKMWINLGHTYEHERELGAAILCYNISANNYYGIQMGALIELGRAYYTTGQYGDAESALKKSMEFMEPSINGNFLQYQQKYIDGMFWLAMVKTKNRTDWNEVIQLFNKVIKLDPDNENACLELSRLMMNVSETAEAKRVLGRCLELKPGRCNLLMKQGDLLLMEGRRQEAVVMYEKCLQYQPNNREAETNLLEALDDPAGRSTERNRALVDRLEMRMETSPGDNHLTQMKIWDLYFRLKEYDKAIYHLDRCLLVDPHHYYVLTALVMIYERKNDTQMTLEYMGRLTSAFPDDVDAWTRLCSFYTNELKNYQLAEQCFERILAIEPENSQHQYNLCILSYQRGDKLHAAECLGRILKKDPTDRRSTRALEQIKTVGV